MSADSQWPLQQAIYDRLRLDDGLNPLLALGGDSVFDHVPINAEMPCCVLADMSAEVLETQSYPGMKILFGIETYSRKAGYQELKAVTARIYDVLHQAEFTLADHEVILCRLKSARYEAVQAGRLRKARQVFEIITEPKNQEI